MGKKQKIFLAIIIILIISFGIVMIIIALSPLRFLDREKNIQKSSKKPEIALNEKYKKQIYINDNKLFIEVSDTDTKREQGLSNIPSLEKNQGMLFDFTNTKYTKPGFWMKQMLFDLDIIWIKNNFVIAITKNIPHPAFGTTDDQLKFYYPPTDIDMVLEINSGWSDEHKIKVGDDIK